MVKKTCFSISTYNQLEHLITNRNIKNNLTIVYIRNYLIKGFGIKWLNTLRRMSKKIDQEHHTFFYVDCGNDYGLSILLIKEKIKYIKLKANNDILKKINSICKKNKVLLNPDFNVVNYSNKI